MSTREERRERFDEQVRAQLRPDVGAVEEGGCDCRLCERDAVFRVPRPHFGGDTKYCPFHLARYRDRHADLYEQVRDLEGVPDPDVHAVVGPRFLSIEEIPERFATDGYDELLRVALTNDGEALAYTAPDADGFLDVVTVDRRLELTGDLELHESRVGAFLVWYRDHEGVHAFDEHVRNGLLGGEA